MWIHFQPYFKSRTVSDCSSVFKSQLEWFCPSQDKVRNPRSISHHLAAHSTQCSGPSFKEALLEGSLPYSPALVLTLSPSVSDFYLPLHYSSTLCVLHILIPRLLTPNPRKKFLYNNVLKIKLTVLFCASACHFVGVLCVFILSLTLSHQTMICPTPSVYSLYTRCWWRCIYVLR